MKKIIFTHAGGRIGIGFGRSMKSAPEPFHLIGLDADSVKINRAIADEKFLIPRAKDSAFLPVLRSIIEETRADLLWVQHEAEIAVVSANRETLPIPTFLPRKATVMRCQDKLASYEWWRHAVPTPPSMLISKPEDLHEAFRRFGASIWLRATTGAGGRGSLPVSDFDTGRRWIDYHQGWGQFMAAKRLSDQTVTWESIWQDGKLIAAQGRRRLYWEFSNLTASGVTGIGGAHRWVNDPALDKIAVTAITAVDPRPNGLFAVDMAFDEQGVPNVTEINIGRFMSGGTISFPHRVNMPYIAVKAALGEPLDIQVPILNPFPTDVYLIHGMDVIPVVVPIREVDRLAENLARRIAALAPEETAAQAKAGV